MHSQNWDNLRFVLAVADQGSVSAAARLLDVNHATVLRRVAAFEAQNGGPVFEKTPTGYRVLPERVHVIEAARDVENAVFSVNRLMQGAQSSMRGSVRISSTDSICQILLPPIIAKLQTESPDLKIELLSNNGHLDFTRMQADILVRPAMALPEGLHGEVATNLIFEACSTPDCDQKWLAMKGPLANSAPAKWMSENVDPKDITTGSDSFLVLRNMAVLGMGIAILPKFVNDAGSDLVLRSEKMPSLPVPIWVGSHADLRDVPRIRTVRQRIQSGLANQI
ncbi:DNA-binding transcriptional regulator, LysR family [Shimia gijangensis]|uniref:DNA-binding transcriptional regulator, LysR family n=1 Tax=Shimia gijangensis TaxID=1470563 RepID=A0A1M6MBA4_9RHOB|nr:LysR family transcriptional regulator [Shimia gijangensis]SHJ80650.1 DNA-binding transcriptional regulator, LysR family [Shimia gijangensis]